MHNLWFIWEKTFVLYEFLFFIHGMAMAGQHFEPARLDFGDKAGALHPRPGDPRAKSGP